ncbi:hypothetical protein BTW07_00710 [Salinicola socius]|uniref:Uncharacterized protein n=1 Tax=Salinicola socius TaxID=404433 RepID=A0A1Q8SXA6_9GAMM|nr:hypothetical protein BTW07_00710 [Salinicola socius]
MAPFGYNERPFGAFSRFGFRLTLLSARGSARGYVGRNPMQEINPINNLIKDLSERTDVLRGYL